MTGKAVHGAPHQNAARRQTARPQGGIAPRIFPLMQALASAARITYSSMSDTLLGYSLGGPMSGKSLQNLAFFLLLALILYVGNLGGA